MSTALRKPRFAPVATVLVALGFISLPSFAQDGAVDQVTKSPGMYAVFETTMGTFVCKLHYDKVPVTVGNFVGLALGEKEFKDVETGEMAMRPFYDGLKFHRIIKNFMIQGGCPMGNGRGGPGYSFPDEFSPDLRHDGPGVLSMANSGPNTNGSQFFVTHVPTPWLDDKHSVFGRVVMGQDVVNAMADVPMKGGQNSEPVEDIVLTKVTIQRTGPEAEAFDWKKEFDRAEEMAARQKRERMERETAEMADTVTKLGLEMADIVEGERGLRWIVRESGTGQTPSSGQRIQAHYTGYLTNGEKFDSSVDRGTPFETAIGVGRVIAGWDMAFQDMKVGEKRLLIIPSDLGYGDRGHPPIIPGGATLLFDVELLAVFE